MFVSGAATGWSSLTRVVQRRWRSSAGTLEVVPDARLVWTNDESDDGAVTTVTFEEKDGKTLLVMSELYPSKQALDIAIEGMGEAMPETFDQLDAFPRRPRCEGLREPNSPCSVGAGSFRSESAADATTALRSPPPGPPGSPCPWRSRWIGFGDSRSLQSSVRDASV